MNEYVGSLVNTLTLYKSSDLRLEVFARFLSEEWDFSTFIDFLNAQRMLSDVRAFAHACMRGLATGMG